MKINISITISILKNALFIVKYFSLIEENLNEEFRFFTEKVFLIKTKVQNVENFQSNYYDCTSVCIRCFNKFVILRLYAFGYFTEALNAFLLDFFNYKNCLN